MRKRNVKIAVINSSLDNPYHSYGDHWVDGWNDAEVEVTVFRYDQIPTIPPTFDLYFFVEVRYELHDIPWYLYPRVLWSWDSHLIPMDTLADYTRYFSTVYLATKKEVDYLKGSGFKNVKWLPEACNPRVHRRHEDVEPAETIAYVTNPSRQPERNGLNKNSYIEFLNNGPHSFRHTRGVFGESYARAMSGSELSIDWPVGTNVGTRMFEAPAMGCAVIRSLPSIGDGNGMEEMLTEGEHFLGFDDTLEGLDRVLKFATDPANKGKMDAMREAARDLVLSKHTYAHRCVRVLEDFGL